VTDDRDSPATRGELAALKAELIKAMLDGQTKVFKGLYSFADTVEDRYRGSDDLEANLKRRMATLDTRILEIERRLNLPPDAA
jgi:hypothetical protein